MKVKAIELGYHGALREPGDEFDVPKGSKASWFEPIAAQAEKKHPKDAEKQEVKEEPLA